MKISFYALVIVLLLFVSPLAYAQEEQNTIRSVRVSGNRRIATETYLYYVTVKPGVEYDESVLREDFRRLWQTGFLNDLKIQIDKTEQGVDVIFEVEERPLIKTVEYVGNDKVSKDDIETKLKDEGITIRTDQPFDPAVGQKAKAAIEKLMQEKGLQFGSVTYKTEMLNDSHSKLTFNIDEGPKARIGEIDFVGNDVFSDGKLKRTMKDTREHWMFSFITRKDDFEKEKFEKDIERVQELYYDHGYINAKIGEPDIQLLENKKRIKITIPVEEGIQFNTGDITFSGNTVFTEQQLLPQVELEPGKVFNRGLLRKSFEEIQQMYGTKGYVYASMGPVFEIKKDQKVVNIKIEVEENGQFFVNRIEFTGNNFTRDKVIRREMMVQEGELLNVTKFRESLDRIYRLGFFDDLKPNITPTENKENLADITLEVKENKRNEIRLGGGYSEFEGFFGNLVFSTRNLFGSGKVFSVSLQSGSRTENYSFDILDPYFLDRRISLGFTVFKSRYDFFDFLRDTTGGSLSFGFPLMEEFRGVLSYGYQIVDITDPDPSSTPIDDDIFPGFELFQSDRIESRLVPQLLRTTINNPTDPSRGTRFLFSNEIVGGPIGGDLNYYKPQISFTAYLPGLAKTHYYAFNVETGWGTGFSGQELPFFERYFLGGERTVRGYELRIVSPIEIDPTTKRQFIAGGNKFFVLNTEYVINIAGPLKVAGFVDYGNAFSKGDSIDFKDMRGSAGLELRFLAPFLSAPFRFIYAVNFNRGILMTLPENNRPERTVFRFSVGTTF